MRGRFWVALALLAGLLSGCSMLTTTTTPPGVISSAQVRAPLTGDPAVPAGMARIYFYRSLDLYDALVWTSVALNGQRVGDSAPGSVFYRDVPPGTYHITVRSDQTYPNQFKTVALAPGSVTFVRIEPAPDWNKSGRQPSGNTFVVSVVDPSIGWIQAEQIRRTGHFTG